MAGNANETCDGEFYNDFENHLRHLADEQGIPMPDTMNGAEYTVWRSRVMAVFMESIPYLDTNDEHPGSNLTDPQQNSEAGQ